MSKEIKGKFITIEGPDGSGKTTLIKSLAQLVREQGRQVLCTREPGGTPLAEKIREILLDTASGNIAPQTEMLLYSAARAQHVLEVIAPALCCGKVVISDRFYDSSTAYQGYGRGLDISFINEVTRLAVDSVVPDLTIILDIDPQEGLRRIKGEGLKLDRLENEDLEFHRRVRAGFLKLAELEPQRVKVIAAAGRKEVLEKAWQHLSEIL